MGLDAKSSSAPAATGSAAGTLVDKAETPARHPDARIAATGPTDYDSTVARYRVDVHAAFEAAHHLLSYRGGEEPVHGHSWRVSIEIVAAGLDAEGMAFDFVAARSALLELARRFDHRDINTVPPFDALSPTTEALATWFSEQMQERLPTARIRSATVWEGPSCSATYYPGDDGGS